MSLITLRSSQATNGATQSESAALIRNFFKEGIELMPGNALELVSMSITKLEKFEIVQGQNDEFIWRIGAGPSALGNVPNFSQHRVNIPAGNYNGADLAQTIQDATNNSTLLGIYKGQWTCTFTSAKPAIPGGAAGTNAKFSLGYAQNTLPPSNGQTLTWEVLGAGNNATLTKEPNHYKVDWTSAAPQEKGETLIENGFYGNKSIYGNGGVFEVHIPPIKDLTDITDMISPDNFLTNYEVDGSDEDIYVDIEKPGGLPNGWVYEMDFEDGPNGQIESFNLPGSHGPVDSITIDSGGNDYDVDDELTLISSEAPPGTGCKIKVLTIDPTGTILTFSIEEGGNGYVFGESCTLTGGNGADGIVSVSGIEDGDGADYAQDDEGILTYETGGSGSGGTYKVLSIGAGGEVTDVEILTPGEGYAAGDVLQLEDSGAGAGSGATIQIVEVSRGVTTNYGIITRDGILGVADSSGSDATNKANWNVGRMKYSPSANIWNGLPGQFGGADLLDGCVLDLDGVGYSSPVFTNTMYPEGRIGVSRDQLIQGITEYPGNANARINNTNTGQDIIIYLQNTATYDDIQVSFTGFDKNPGFNYPDQQWRRLKQYTNALPSSGWATLQGGSATNWTNFTYASDTIRIRIEQYGVRNNRFYVSHDKNGDQQWEEEELLLKTGDTNNIQFTSNVREILYPYCPTAFLSRGNRFDTASYKFFGIFDTERIAAVPGLIGSKNAAGVDHLVEVDNPVNEDVGMDLDAETPLQFGAIFKMGIVDAADIYDGAATGAGPNQMSNRDVVPNTANISFVTGLETAYTIQPGQATNSIATADTRQPETSILEPSLHVELPDFNIKSYSGESGDTGRAVAVIPKEQWTTDSKTGTLQYIAPYPIPIDLRIPNYQVINEINARLRQPSGELANDLINPTEICLRLTETYESQQQRVMTTALRGMNSKNSNLQDNKISNFNSNMPKI
jgi:hypothetical protein